jgi:hypothetical protein
MLHKSTPVRSFAADRRGSVAVIFGLLAIPVLGIIGSAIDYGRALKAKQDLQSVLDGAALAATTEFGKSGDTTAASASLRRFVEDGLAKQGLELLPPPQAGEDPPALGNGGPEVLLQNTEFDASSGTINPKLTTRVGTTLLALLDVSYFEVEAETKSGLAGKKLELSMMLDITGSMCNSAPSSNDAPCSTGGKLDGMKAAAKDLVDIVFRGQTTNTRVAIVPFSHGVNVGSFAAAATGQPASRNYSYACRSGHRWTTCTTTEYRSNAVAEMSNGEPFKDEPPGEGSYSKALWSKTNQSQWPWLPDNSSTLLPLTSDRSVVDSKIDSLKGKGGTAGHIGTAWAWYTLSNKWATFWGPASAPEPVSPTILKAAVLMTDGDYSWHYSAGNSCNGSDHCPLSHNEARHFCRNMKDQGIRVFTVGFAIEDDRARDTLIDCASPGDYHFPYSPEQMREAFRSIGNALIAGSAGPVLSN